MTRETGASDLQESPAVFKPTNDFPPEKKPLKAKKKRIPDALYALGIAPIEEEQMGKTG